MVGGSVGGRVTAGGVGDSEAETTDGRGVGVRVGTAVGVRAGGPVGALLGGAAAGGGVADGATLSTTLGAKVGDPFGAGVGVEVDGCASVVTRTSRSAARSRLLNPPTITRGEQRLSGVSVNTVREDDQSRSHVNGAPAREPVRAAVRAVERTRPMRVASNKSGVSCACVGVTRSTHSCKFKLPPTVLRPTANVPRSRPAEERGVSVSDRRRRSRTAVSASHHQNNCLWIFTSPGKKLR